MISRDLSLPSQQRKRVSVSLCLPAETTASTPTPRAVSTLLCFSRKAAQTRHLPCPGSALGAATLPGHRSHERANPGRPVPTSSRAAPLPPLSAGSGAPEGRPHGRTPPQYHHPHSPPHTQRAPGAEGAPAEPEERSEHCPAAAAARSRRGAAQ